MFITLWCRIGTVVSVSVYHAAVSRSV